MQNIQTHSLKEARRKTGLTATQALKSLKAAWEDRGQVSAHHYIPAGGQGRDDRALTKESEAGALTDRSDQPPHPDTDSVKRVGTGERVSG